MYIGQLLEPAEEYANLRSLRLMIGMAIPWQRAPPRRPTSEEKKRKLVEAAGIEPASESTPLFGSTCLSRDLSSSGGSNTGTLSAGPSPNHLAGGSRGRVPGQPTFLTGLSGAMGCAPEVPRA